MTIDFFKLLRSLTHPPRHVARLFLEQNKFTGTIPRTIKQLGKLVALDMSGNRLSGPLPQGIAGIFGALVAVYLRGFTNDVYFQIGLVTLLGLSAKNAILIVEFATVKVQEGLSPVAAALEAARLRFRPILMTSLAFILGVVPLAFSSGAGAAARQSIGTGVLGGMLAATFLAVFLVPLFFKLVNDWHFRSKPSDFDNLNKPIHLSHGAQTKAVEVPKP